MDRVRREEDDEDVARGEPLRDLLRPLRSELHRDVEEDVMSLLAQGSEQRLGQGFVVGIACGIGEEERSSGLATQQGIRRLDVVRLRRFGSGIAILSLLGNVSTLSSLS